MSRISSDGQFIEQILRQKIMRTAQRRACYLLGTLPRIAAGSLLAAGSCHAAAPVYFDLGGLILYGVLYLIGLLILLAVVVFSQKRAGWSSFLVAYVTIPVAYVFITLSIQRARNDQVLEDARAGEAKNLEALAAYCKDRNRVVNTRVAASAETSLLVRQEKGFSGVAWQFNAFPIHEYMVNNREICNKTGLGHLEGIYDGQFVPEKRLYEREVRLYEMCSPEKWHTSTESQSRYELVLGELSEKKPVPWGGSWMSKSSVRLIDKKTGATLAEDTMFFLRYESGDGGCPNGLEQLASLITEVFPNR